MRWQGLGDKDEVVEGVDVAEVLDGDDEDIGKVKFRHLLTSVVCSSFES